MIKNIPTAQSFYDAGKECLNLAWTMVYELVRWFKGADEWYGVDIEREERFWHAARRELLTALTIAQQGVELTLKGKIADVSPFLLITNFTERAKLDGVDYGAFYTINESDIIKACSCISSIPLDEEVRNKFNEFRLLRNEVMHTDSIKFKDAPDIKNLAKKIVGYILFMSEKLYSARWIKLREYFIENSTYEILSEEPNSRLMLCNEVNRMIDFLNSDVVRDYFQVNKKNKSFYCPECYSKCGNENDQFENIRLAYLKSGTKLYCPVCDKTFDIHFGDCCCCDDNRVYEHMCINCLDEDQGYC